MSKVVDDLTGPNLNQTGIFLGQTETGPNVIGLVFGPQNVKIRSSGPSLDQRTPLAKT